MGSERLQAHYENRIYYFNLIKKDAERVVVNLYSTEYALEKKDGTWQNAVSNKNNLSDGLLSAVLRTIGVIS